MNGIFHAFNLRKFKKIALFMVIPLIVGWISSLLVGDVDVFYASVAKPALSPPVWVFYFVWTVLYILAGYAAYLTTDSFADDSIKRRAALLHYAHLAIGLVWPLILVKAQGFGLAFLCILMMLALCVAATVAFYDIRRRAGWMMVPFVAWLAFVGHLNYMIWVLN